jgi:hypothetical protein
MEMKPPIRHAMLLTHGAAILLGCLAGKILLGDTTSSATPARNSARSAVRSSSMETSSAWLDESLRKARAEKAKVETIQQTRLMIPKLLKKCREEADAERKEDGEWIDEIVENSIKYANEPDPAAAIRRHMRAGNWRENHSLEILQAWLDKDPEAALAELDRNWALQKEEDLAGLLERRFGRDWLTRQVEDDNAPYRLRTSLADGLGRDLAWEGGLDGLLHQYNSISDPALKMRLAYSFSESWPLDDPLVTARFMEKDVPSELRNCFLGRWKPPAEFGVGSSSFPVGIGMPPTYATHEWFEQVRAAMNPESLPEDLRNPIPQITDEMIQRRLRIESLEETVKSHIKSGDTPEKAAERVLSSKVEAAIGEGTDLAELYGEGQMTRHEFLAELARRIPGSGSYPDTLERVAWKQTANGSDPKQVVAWAAELSQRRSMNDILENGMYSSNDPRMLSQLASYQDFSAAMNEGRSLVGIRREAVFAWLSWQEISPALAADWRNSLTEEDPLRVAIRDREAQQKQERETP